MVTEIDRLLDHHTEKEIAGILNERGVRSGDGKAFHSRAVARVRTKYQLKSRYDRLREKGLLTIEEISDRLNAHAGVGASMARPWIASSPPGERQEPVSILEDPGPDPPRKAQGTKLSERRRFTELAVHGSQEVQYEA